MYKLFYFFFLRTASAINEPKIITAPAPIPTYIKISLVVRGSGSGPGPGGIQSV